MQRHESKQARQYVLKHGQGKGTKRIRDAFLEEAKEPKRLKKSVEDFDKEMVPIEDKSIPKLLNPQKISHNAEHRTHSYLTDGELTELAATNSIMQARILSNHRFKVRLRDPIRRDIQSKRLFAACFRGVRLTLDLIEKNIEQEIGKIFDSLQEKGITNYQTLYACYHKLNYLGYWNLSEAELILLSGNNEAIDEWLKYNREKVENNEHLNLRGMASAIHYLALSGNAVMVDKVLSLNCFSKASGAVYAFLYAAFFSGNPKVLESKQSKEILEDYLKKNPGDISSFFEAAQRSGDSRIINYCLANYPDSFYTENQDLACSGNMQTYQQYKSHPNNEYQENTILRKFAKSGNVSSLKKAVVEYKVSPDFIFHSTANKSILLTAINDFKGDSKQIDPEHDNRTLHFHAAENGSTDVLEYCIKKLKLNPKVLTSSRRGLLHAAAKSGNPDTLLFCANKLKLNIDHCDATNESVAHNAAFSHNPTQMLMCVLLNAKLDGRDDLGKTVAQYAAYEDNLNKILTCQLLGLSVHDIDYINVQTCSLLKALIQKYHLEFSPNEEKSWINDDINDLPQKVLNCLNSYIKRYPNSKTKFYDGSTLPHKDIAIKLCKYIQASNPKEDYQLFFMLNNFLIDSIINKQLKIKSEFTAYIRFATNQVLQAIWIKRDFGLLASIDEPSPKAKMQC